MVDSSEEVLGVLQDMDDAGVKATPITHRLAISSMLKRDDTVAAIELAQVMEQSEGRLDAMIMVNLLKSVCRKGQHDAALKFLRDSLKSSEVDVTLNDSYLRIYHALIEGMMDIGRVRDAENLMEEMCAVCQPIIKTWQLMIEGYIKANRLADAAKAFSVIVEQPLLRKRSESGDRRIDNIIASLVHAFLQKDMYHEAERLVSQCVEHGDWRGTNTKIWRHFIEYLCSPAVGRTEDAWDLFRFQVGKIPSAQQHFLYKDMLEFGCLNLSDTQAASTLLAEIKEKSIVFEQYESAWFMHLAMQHGDRLLAEEILESIEKQLKERGERKGPRLIGTIERWSL
ncbi:hypothetical protein BCR37DRAFT_379957 [Protomyces lactucae-debilis]|uniref:Pentacotripeptide-repeat region of PRORP domain-containing protein n=1 Tax=Protomyces lactucae-debilis TaxID=2754530 RepID=A0A1Y2FDN8_PROLT|nr:uncharacterized protein BCR37DRAFT_379957 [Protomyces lactucae-debilis]ORY82038.1 hypothetical protein BCR37DRAFT_379957 [Protomyces lactucae-debilis]